MNILNEPVKESTDQSVCTVNGATQTYQQATSTEFETFRPQTGVTPMQSDEPTN